MALEGIDTSVYQGSPNWQAVRDAGITFALTKATEGVGFIDPTFGRNWSEMLRVGFPAPGAYHFARPDLGNAPENEADFFLAVVESVTGSAAGTLLALDIEVDPATAAWCVAFEARVRDRLGGYHAGFYSFSNWLRTHDVAGQPQLAANWLWLAWPDVNGPLPLPAPWPVVAIQQYGIGSVPGIAGPVDVNRFFGGIGDLLALTVGGGIPTGGQRSMAVGQTLFLNGVNHLFMVRSDGAIMWSATGGGAGGLISQQQRYLVVPGFSFDVRDIWVSQDRGPARADGSGETIDRILLFAAFGDGRVSMCVLNPADVANKVLDWTEPLPSQGYRVRVPTYQGQVLPAAMVANAPAGPAGPPGPPIDTSAFARQADLDALREHLHQV